MEDTARAAAELGVTQVNGFTGLADLAPPLLVPAERLRGRRARLQRLRRALGPDPRRVRREGVRFGLEVHPTEIAYDFVTTAKALDAVDRREAFGINLDPSHFAHQFLDTAAFALEFADRIYHVHVKDSKRRLDGRRSILASHLNFGDESRGWDFVSPGHGDVDFEDFFRALNRIGYRGRSRSSGRTRDGPRVRRAGRAGVRPAHRLPAVGAGLRRGDAAEGG